MAIGENNNADCNDLLKKLVEKFNLKYATIILRNRFTAEDVDWTAVLYDGKDFYNSKKYDIHAKNDTSVPIKHAEYILKHVGSKDKTLSIIERGTHIIPEDYGKEQAFSLIDDWITKRI